MASKIQSMLANVVNHHRRQAQAVDALPLDDRAETLATVAATVVALVIVCLMAVLMGMT